MAQKTGYLAEKLKLFHLSDKRQWTCPYHYHDFDKITLFFRGHVAYDVEGAAYDLKPFDIVVIPAGRIHTNAAAVRPGRYSHGKTHRSCASPRKRTIYTMYHAACVELGPT